MLNYNETLLAWNAMTNAKQFICYEHALTCRQPYFSLQLIYIYYGFRFRGAIWSWLYSIKRHHYFNRVLCMLCTKREYLYTYTYIYTDIHNVRCYNMNFSLNENIACLLQWKAKKKRNWERKRKKWEIRVYLSCAKWIESLVYYKNILRSFFFN